jgi:hypothetical protein
MFFFIAGIQPKTVELESHDRMCAACGRYQARMKRMDHYFSFFFVPLFRVKKGHPFIECRSCGSLLNESGQPWFEPHQDKRSLCPSCGETLNPGFRYCPSCGKPIR